MQDGCCKEEKMGNLFYTVIENQGFSNGTFALLFNHYTDENQAYSKYYTICAAAALSEIPYHAAHLLRSDGNVSEYRVWDRRNEG